MILTYKVLSLLLDYPSEMLIDSLPNIGKQLRKENYLNEEMIKNVEIFADNAAAMPLTHWQEQYVTLFDQGKDTNLYLFDHVYGSSRERGQAMADLKQMYTGYGFIPCSDEIPDYLPLYLEFLSMQSNTKDAELMLADTTQILEKMYEQLKKQQTPYSNILEIVYHLSTRIHTASSGDIKEGVTS